MRLYGESSLQPSMRRTILGGLAKSLRGLEGVESGRASSKEGRISSNGSDSRSMMEGQ